MNTPILRTICRRRLPMIAAGTLGLCLYQAAEASIPILIGASVDTVLATGQWWAPILAIGVLALLLTTVSMAWRFSMIALNRVAAIETRGLRARLAERVVTPDRTPDARPGELVTIAAEDTGQAADVVEIVPVGIAAAIGVLICSGALIAIDPLLGIGVLAGVVATLLVLQLLSRLITRAGRHQQELLAAATARVADLLAGLRPLTGIGGQAAAYRGYLPFSHRARRQSEGLALLTGGYAGLSAGFGVALIGLVALAAGWRALSGAITVGELVTVVGLAQFVFEPLQSLSRIPRYAALARASAQRIASVAAAQPGPGTRELPLPGPTWAIEVGGRNGWRAVEGEFTAITCSLADAVALGQVLHGAEDPDPGRPVLVRGVPLTELAADALRRGVLCDTRHPAIFSGPVAETVDPRGWFATAEAPGPEHWLASVRLAELSERGPISDRGAELSGGQRQRLTLARALAADPEILVLIDPLSSVDAVTGALVAAEVVESRRGRTTIVLAADPAFVRLADHCADWDANHSN